MRYPATTTPARRSGPSPAPAVTRNPGGWHAAFARMARVEGIDVRHLTDGQLLARRRAYEAETSWAPKHIAAELRAARRQEQLGRGSRPPATVRSRRRGPARRRRQGAAARDPRPVRGQALERQGR